jgi:glycosyltransferase involved in cell wall biosynthesis
MAKNIKDYDIIIAWNAPMHLVWIFSKLIFKSKAKVIWYNHHYPWYFDKKLKNIPNILKGYIEKKLVKYIDKIIVNSTYLKKEIDNIYNVKSYILNPILDELFIKNSPKKIEEKQNILFVNSRWIKWKNIKIVFDTYEKLKLEINNVKLIVWWDWEELKLYKTKYKNDNNITFLWLININEIIDNLLISKIFLFPSKIDSFWMVALESMSMWVPVVAYNKGWITDLINSWNSFLVNNDEDFYLKTLELFLDNKKYNNLSLNWLNVTYNFNISVFSKKLKKIL